MLFSRRDKETFSQRMRVALWPRRSFWRSIKYLILRVLRLTASPHTIAMGVAAGSFASFTPFLGFHFIIAFIICFFTRGSYVAAATGTFLGNPLTFPFIWVAVLSAGRFVLYGGDVANAPPLEVPELNFDVIMNSFDTVWPVIMAMTIGAFPVGLPISIVVYFIIRQMARIYQASRLSKLAERARDNLAHHIDEEMDDELMRSLEAETALSEEPRKKAS